MRLRLAGLFLILTLQMFAQSGPTLVGAGYAFPTPVIAPGQILRLQFSGLRTVLSPNLQRATSVPLPTSLANISLSVRQSVRQSTSGPAVETSYTAPLLAISQVNICSAGVSSE